MKKTTKYVGCYKDNWPDHPDIRYGPQKILPSLPDCRKACRIYKYITFDFEGHCECDNDFSSPKELYPKVNDDECKNTDNRNPIY